MIRTIVVEDEPLSRMYLCNLLAEGFPDLEIIGTAATEAEALEIISTQKPEIVFLDIELQNGTGINVATQLEACAPAIIFTTALDELATNVLRITGVPFIQKPIDADNLAQAVAALRDPQNCARYSVAQQQLRIAMQHKGIPQSLLVVSDQQQYVLLRDIISIEASGFESLLRLSSGQKITTRQELKQLNSMLQQIGFFRSDIQHLVNLRHIKAVRQEFVLMQDGHEVPLSPKKTSTLQACLSALPVQL